MHRGDFVDDVVRAALEISERFTILAGAVDRMERTVLDQAERQDFAAQALALRFPSDRPGVMTPAVLLVPRRSEDAGNALPLISRIPP